MVNDFYKMRAKLLLFLHIRNLLFAFMLFSQPIALAYFIILSKKFGNVRKM